MVVGGLQPACPVRGVAIVARGASVDVTFAAIARRLTVSAPRRYGARMRILLAILLSSVTAVAHAGDMLKTQAAGLRFQHPSSWTRVPAPSDMRAAQFRVPRTEGDADDGEFVLFFFGKGQGGGTQENIDRWRGQMGAADGAPSKDAGVVTIKTIRGLKVTALDVSGTYKGMGPAGGAAAAKSGYRLLAAVVEGDPGPWFFRLVGPAATVAAAKPGFDALLESVEAHQ